MATDSPVAGRFVQARSYTKGPRRGPITVVVIHDMEAPETTKTAENVARYFATTAPASAHYCVDSDSVVQCVREADIAWHAPGANANGVGVELAGYAKQTAAQWADPFSHAMLILAAQLVADICKRNRIPAVYVTAAGLKAGKQGVTLHRDVTAAFHRSTHTDPGPNFPMSAFMGLVVANMHPAAPKPPLLELWYLVDGPDKGAIVLPRPGRNALLLSGPDLGVWQAKGWVVVHHAGVPFDRS